MHVAAPMQSVRSTSILAIFFFGVPSAIVFTVSRFFDYRSLDYRSPTTIDRRPRDLLVDILVFALMPNHYHLLLRQRAENGISLFMQKLGGGYTRYFNEKRQCSGVLFQGGYQLKPILDHRYLDYLAQYIHFNPVELFAAKPGKTSRDAVSKISLDRFRSYRWSSYRDYLGIKNFPSVLNLALAKDLGLVAKSKNETSQERIKRGGAQRDELTAYIFEED